MNRIQLIIILAGLIMVVGLFLLPKYVVDTTSGEVERNSTGPSEDFEDGDMVFDPESHGIKISDSDRAEIGRLKASLDPKVLERYDTLADTYARFQKYDSAAYIAEQKALLTQSLVDFEKAGLYYYEAFGFAAERKASERFGEKAREYLGAVLEDNSTRLDVKSKIAMTHVSSTNPMMGIRMLREVIEEDPLNEEGLYNLGILSIQSGQHDRAVNYLERLLAIDSLSVQGRFYYGISLMESGKKRKAKEVFDGLYESSRDPAVRASIKGYLEEME